MTTLYTPINLAYHGIAFALGVTLHLSVFRRGEWNIYALSILQYFAIFEGIFTCVLRLFLGSEKCTTWIVVSIALTATLSTLVGLFTSMLIYRGFFHPLKGYPGPFSSRFSSLYITFRAFKNRRLFEELQLLHKTYGDIVRIEWANASKGLRRYEDRVAEYTTQILQHIEALQDEPLDISMWFNFYSFDVMGDLAFGKSFDMLSNGTKHPFMELTHSHMLVAGSLSRLAWIFPLLKRIPIFNQKTCELEERIKQLVDWRIKNEPDVPDIFSWILRDYCRLIKPTGQETLNLYGDAQLIAVAGSDTTAASLTCLFFELAINPQALHNVQEEIDRYHLKYSTLDHQSLSKLSYLQACINESMRLYPLLPSGLQRITPPEGLQVGSIHLPGDTIISIPSYAFNRDERLFKNADQFIPERWTTMTELTRDSSLFTPFSIGKYSCVGRQLGLMEIRFVASQILRVFDVKLANCNTAKEFASGLRDSFTLACPNLHLVFTRRDIWTPSPISEK
ncbi:Averantin oxidoreductase [Fusarium oxysporum f. sp. cubense race 1]|uniref:Averantin oxidoreductase n=1 Tax=Fusarium oxysporum f. sp. cubense (strain race 1) TaxID=1229664 RepID=N4TR82_FUSC1|nr:Averantin oxidoreductase [Fusarium oxysporum f. sp. cubense race 1]